MASSSKRRSRKRRNRESAPRAVPSQRREQRAEREITVAREQRRRESAIGTTYGERPPSPFGGLPVSEIAIFAGVVGVIVGLVQGGGPALIAGLIVCALGVIEVTAREHFSGYRSHTTLLAAIPTVALEVALASSVGQPRRRGLLLLVVPVFGLLFWLLRKRFQAARQARVARPPQAPLRPPRA